MGIKNIEFEANQGNAEAQVKLGRIYLSGLGVDVDYKKAHNCFVKAAKAQNADGYAYLAYTYALGLGVEKNDEKVVSYFQKASELNDDYSSFALGFIYRKGLFGVEKDEAQALEYVQKASNNNFGPAKYEHAFLLEKQANKLKKSNDAQDVKKADEMKAQILALYKDSANSNYAPAQYALAVRLLKENNPQKDVEAFKYLEAAKEGDYALAYYALATLYDEGRGCEQDFYKSFEYYEKAYELGYKKAVLDIANAYIYGLGCKQSYKSALDVCRDAVNGGIQEANYFAGMCFEYGLGVDQDYEKAIELYGYASYSYFPATIKLGQIYDPYYGIGADEVGAREEYEQAAQNGSIDGMAEIAKLDLDKDEETHLKELKNYADMGSAVANEVLGTLYKDGKCVKQDAAKALEYYKKASKLGSDKATKEIIEIAKAKQDKALEEAYTDRISLLGSPKGYFTRAKVLFEEGETERSAFWYAMGGLATQKEENKQKAVDILKEKFKKDASGAWGSAE